MANFRFGRITAKFPRLDDRSSLESEAKPGITIDGMYDGEDTIHEDGDFEIL